MHTLYVDIDAVLDFSNAAILKVTCLVKGMLHYGGNEPEHEEGNRLEVAVAGLEDRAEARSPRTNDHVARRGPGRPGLQ